MNLIQVIILSIIEGLTEFLPVSSTGHMMIAENLMGMQSTDFLKTFTVGIQLGAILSVVVFYFKRFFNFKSKNKSGLYGWNLYLLLIVGSLPAVVIGYFFNDYVDKLLDRTWIVVLALFLGGLLMVFLDRQKYSHERKILLPQALIIGFYQCLAMIPGTSRSMVTILGGMQQGLTRKQAAEFSFFLAIPIMFGATALKLYKGFTAIDGDVKGQLLQNIDMFLLGNAVAFVVALISIKFFIGFVSRYGFKVFGIYRIILSVVLGILMFYGIIPMTLN